MSQDANKITWGGIIVLKYLESSDRVDDGPWNLCTRYFKEYETPLQWWGATIFIWLSSLSIFELKWAKTPTWWLGMALWSTPLWKAQIESMLGLAKILKVFQGVWNYFTVMRCHHIVIIVVLVHLKAEMSQDANMMTWDVIMVYTRLKSTDRVNDGPCHLSIWYFKEYETPLRQWGATILLQLSFWLILEMKWAKMPTRWLGVA